MELSKERLIEIVNDDQINQGSEFAIMARRLLAAEEQQPVAWVTMQKEFCDDERTAITNRVDADRYSSSCYDLTPLYASPQLPQQGKAAQVKCPFPCGWDNLNKYAIQDAAFVACGLVDGEVTTEAHRQAAIKNSDRLLKVISAMLSNEPVSNRDELAEEVTEGMQQAKASLSQWLLEGKQIFDPEYLKDEEGNYPVIPEGWKLVPIEPTENMIIHGFESEPDESFSDENDWQAYEAMSGCQQAAHRAKLCWSAMLSAAPQPEVK